MPFKAERETAPQQDFLPLLGTDHVELYVGNAKQAAYYYRTAFGMRLTAYQGPETGIRDRASYVLEQGKIRLILTSALRPNHPIADYVYRHGDGVRVIALQVDDAKTAYSEVKSRGARISEEPTELRDEFGLVRLFTVAAYGDTVHTFLERRQYAGAFLPGYLATHEKDSLARPVGLTCVDHIVRTVGQGELNQSALFYEKFLGFQVERQPGDAHPHSGRIALLSKVVTDGGGRIHFLLQEAVEDPARSMGEEYLDFCQRPGMHRIALSTDNILETVSRLKAQGVGFLNAPPSCHAVLETGPAAVHPKLRHLAHQGILTSVNGEGYCLRALSKPVQDRPTVCFEIIERPTAL